MDLKQSHRLNLWHFCVLMFVPTLYLLLTLSVLGFPSLSHNPSNITCIATIFISMFGIYISLVKHSYFINCALFWYFNLIFFGITQLLVLNDSQSYYLNNLFLNPNIHYASILILVSSILFLVGQLFGSNHVTKSIYSTDIRSEILIKRRLNFVFYIYLVILPFIVSYLGGFRYLFKLSRNQSFNYNMDNSVINVLQSIMYVTPIVVLLTNSWLQSQKSKLSIGRSKQILLLILVLFYANPIGQSRQLLLFLTFPLIYNFLKKNSFLILGFFGSVPLLMLTTNETFNRDTGGFSGFRLVLASRSGDFDAFSQLVNSIRAIDLGVFPIMHQILGSIFFFVPRSFFESKPKDTGVVLGEAFSLNFTNLSAPWQAELLVNFRLIGIVIGAVLLGLFLAKLDHHSTIQKRIEIFSAITFGSLFIILRGSLLQATGRYVFASVLVFFLSSFRIKYARIANLHPMGG